MTNPKPRNKQTAILLIFVAAIFSLPIFAGNLLVAMQKKQAQKTTEIKDLPLFVHHGPNPATQLVSIAHNPEINQVIVKSLAMDGSDKKQNKPIVIGRNGFPESRQNRELADGVGGEQLLDYGIAAGGGLPFYGQEKMEAYFKSLKELGVKWVRWDIDWGFVQPDGPTEYDWTNIDRTVEMAKKYEIKSLGIITYTPEWAAVKNCKKNARCAPIDLKAFGKFAGEVALRYKDSISHWEIWNEPNYVFFWSPKPDAVKYSEVLKEAYREIKKANPDAVVLSGGLAATGDEKDGSLSPLTFVTTLYKLGANKYFDHIALHPYTYPASTDYKAWWNRWQQNLPIRQLMVEKGDADKKIWITEFGAPTGGPGKQFYLGQLEKFRYGIDFMYEKAQGELMAQAMEYTCKNQEWLGPFFWFSLQDASEKRTTPENFFGILRFKGSKKPAYDIFQKQIGSVCK